MHMRQIIFSFYRILLYICLKERKYKLLRQSNKIQIEIIEFKIVKLFSISSK